MNKLKRPKSDSGFVTHCRLLAGGSVRAKRCGELQIDAMVMG
jgi:hypothetical protein